MNPDELDRMVTQVRELCTDQSLSDIRTDLKKTKSVEMTINRILDGSFLEGTESDPTLRINHATIILDSDDEMEQPLSQKQQPSKQTSAPSSSVYTTTIQRQISIDSSPDQPQRIKPIPKTAAIPHSLYHSNKNKDEDDDNDSLPSLDALITQMTHKETRPIDTIELDDTPPRNYTTSDILNKKRDEEMNKETASSLSTATKTSKKRTYTPLELLDQEEHMLSSRKRKSSPSLDFLKEWESDAEEELLISKNKIKGKGKGRQQPKKNKTTTTPMSKKQKSPSVEIDFLKQWDSSSSSNGDNNEEEEEEDLVGSSSARTEETAKEKRERLNKQKAEERKQKAEKRKEEQSAKKAERERAKQEKKV
ncbi:hypothetical protein BDC45DRAFT_211711 [Circinella umbellata]|nr:hypothetical protein BDC45DRAFT_211711 [Circinella umbellata]